LLACMEVESALKSVLVANGRTPDRPTMNDYVALADPMRLSEWAVALVRSTGRLVFRPFSRWMHPRAASPALGWYSAYNTTKHGRETHLNEAQLGHVLNALAAVYILFVAQFGLDAAERLRHRPFEMIQSPEWSLDEFYALSAFDGGSWQPRPAL